MNVLRHPALCGFDMARQQEELSLSANYLYAPESEVFAALAFRGLAEAAAGRLEEITFNRLVRQALKKPVYEAVIPWPGVAAPRMHVAIGNFEPVTATLNGDDQDYHGSRFYQAMEGGMGDDEELRMRLRSEKWAKRVNEFATPRRLHSSADIIVWDLTKSETELDPYTFKKTHRQVPVSTGLGLYGHKRRT